MVGASVNWQQLHVSNIFMINFMQFSIIVEAEKMINDSSRKPKSSSRMQGDQREKLFIVLINSHPHRCPNLLRIFMRPKRIIIA